MSTVCQTDMVPFELRYLNGRNQLEERIFAIEEIETKETSAGGTLVFRGIDIGESAGLSDAIARVKADYPVMEIVCLVPDGYGAVIRMTDGSVAEFEFDLPEPPFFTTLQMHRVGQVIFHDTGQVFANGNELAAALIEDYDGEWPDHWPVNLFALNDD